MSNEIDILSNNEIAPYDAGMPVLAPLSPSPDTWGRTDVDEYQHAPQGATLFGSPLPAGTTQAQVESMLGRLTGAFMADLSSIGYPSHMINAAVQFVNDNALKKPYQVTPRHNFNLHGEDDYLAHGFGNMVQGLAGSPRAKQQFVTACLQWLAKATKQLNSGVASLPAQGRAPSISTEAMLAQLSDKDYNAVIAINDKALAQTMQVLQERWGTYTFRQNIAIAQDYLEKLPSKDQQFFDQFTTTAGGQSWVHMRNTPEFIIAMFDAATGAHNLPTGAGIAREIAECERCMKEHPKQWRDDNALQARYRTLLDMRDRP